MSTSIKLLIECRLSYVHLFKPAVSSEGAKPKYSVSLIIPKTDTELIEKIQSAIDTAYKSGIGTFGGKLPPKGTWWYPLRDGDTARKDDPNYAGCYFIGASCKKKPGLVKKGTVTKFAEITDESELYSGCYGVVSVNFYAFNKAGNKGVAVGINNVLKTKDGEFLGGSVSAEADFDELDMSAYDSSDIDEEEVL